MQYSPKGFQDIAPQAKMAPAELQSPLNFADGGLVYNSQRQINDIMASPNSFSGMSNQLNMATGGMVQSEELMQEPSQGLPQYYPVSGEPTQQQSPFATGLMPQDTPPLTPPVAPPSISTPYPARVMGSFSNSPGSNSIAPPLSSVDQTKTIADPAPVPAPTISPVAMAHGGAVGGDRMASTMKAEFSKRGLDFDKYMAKRLAAKGRNGDTMLAHINPSEAQMLKQAGGSGRINPDTGLMAFDNPSQGDYGNSNYGNSNYGGLYGGGNGSPSSNSGGYKDQGRGSGVTDARPNPGGGNTGGSDKGGGRDRQDSPPTKNVGDKVAYDPTSGKFYAKVGNGKLVNVPTGPTEAQKQAASDAARQRVTDQLAMERAQEAQRQQQLAAEEAQRQKQNLANAYNEMAANRNQYPQGPLSTFGDGSDIVKTGSFDKQGNITPDVRNYMTPETQVEKSFGENAWDAIKSGAGSAYDAVSSGMSAVDDYFKYNPKDLTLASIAGSANLRPVISSKPQDQVLPDSAESAYVAKTPLQQLTRGIDAKNVSTVAPDMSSQAAAPVETTVKSAAPPAAPAVSPPAAAPPKKEGTFFENIFNDIVEHPVKTGVNLVTSLIPGGALVNAGSNLTGMYPSVGQMAENAINGQGIFSNAPQGLLTGLTGGANASSPNQNMLTYDPVASYQNGAQFIPETTMGYGPYGNLTREQYRDQYGGRDAPVIPINTTPAKPKTPTTPDTTTPETPTNGLGLATYDPRTYLGAANDPYNYGFGGEQVYYKAMGGAVGPLSQKRK
jgi:hypothetical protein